ncbi:MAG: anti-sigma factor, partial [Bacteroides sp.]
MLKQPFHIAELIARYLTETLTEQEKCKLEEWINESPENKALFHNLCDSEQQRLHNQKSNQYSNRQGW